MRDEQTIGVEACIVVQLFSFADLCDVATCKRSNESDGSRIPQTPADQGYALYSRSGKLHA